MGFANRAACTFGVALPSTLRYERKTLDPVPEEGEDEGKLNTAVSRGRYSARIKQALKWRTRSKMMSHFSALLGQV